MMDYENNDRQQDQSSPVTGELVPVDKVVLLSSVVRTLTRWLLIGLALYAVGWLLWNGRTTLLPFAIGAILAFVLTPIVNQLSKHMPRWLAILTIYVAGLVILTLLFIYVVPLLANQFQQIIDSIPSVSQMQGIVTDLLNRYQQVVPSSLREPINISVNNAVQAAENNLTIYMRSLLLLLIGEVLQIFQTIAFIAGFVVVPFWLFYVLNSETSGRVFINRILHPRLRPDFWNIWDIINDVLSNYVRGQLLLGVVVGSMVGVGMVILQLIGIPVPYLFVLALIAGITELIPYIGPLLGAVPGLLAGILISPTTGLAMLAVYIIVQQFENNLLVPRIIGSHISIHPAILTIILFAAGGTFGLVGVFIASPVAAISRDVFVYVYHRLQGETPEEVVLLLNGMH